MQQLTRQDYQQLSHLAQWPKPMAGLTAQAMIMALEGEVHLLDLRIGQPVITRDSGLAVLRAIRATAFKGAVIQIKAGALGHARRHSDLMIGPA